MNHSYILLLLLGASTSGCNLQGLSTKDKSYAELECPGLFEEVGGRCLYFENVNKGSWSYIRSICQDLGGDLLKLDSGDLFTDIIRHIHGNGWADDHYWIGATDEGHEGIWTWTDGTSVQMGTPFWASIGCDNVQQPTGGTKQNCGLLDGGVHMYFNDIPCDLFENGICEI